MEVPQTEARDSRPLTPSASHTRNRFALNNNHRLRHSAQLSFLALALLLLLTGSALATSGTLGSVSSPTQTSSSITATWTPPTGDYTHCASVPEYKVCIKESGNLQIACNQEQDFTSGFSYTFDNIAGTSLVPGTLYKIVVYANTRKNGGSCKFREVSTIKQATLLADPFPGYPPMVPEGHLSLSSTAGGISATAHFFAGENVTPAMVRICYKAVWWVGLNLLGACKNPWSWGNTVKGAIEIVPSGTDTTAVFSGLPSCRQYRVVAYGYPGELLLGEGSIETGGSCDKVATDFSSGFILEQLISHHPDVAQEYQSATDRYLKGQGKRNGLIDVLVACDRSVATELQELAADSETVTTDTDLLDYVSTRKPSVLDCWQSSVPRNLTLEPFLTANNPAVLEQIRADLDRPR